MKFFAINLFVFIFLLGCGNNGKNESRTEIPSYSIINSIEMYGGKGKAAYILMPSISREMKVSEREKLLKEIMKTENWVYLAVFNSKLAYQERNCDSYNQRKPAYKAGFIGVVNQFGQFSD